MTSFVICLVLESQKQQIKFFFSYLSYTNLPLLTRGVSGQNYTCSNLSVCTGKTVQLNELQ